VWQALHEELAPLGLSVITVAIDATLAAARPYVLSAGATHPSLVDTEHTVADLYNMVNVPTVLRIDETGRIVRPNDVHYVSDEYSTYTKFHPRKPMNALRAWVRGEADALAPELQAKPIDQLVAMPTQSDQEARAAFAVAWNLSQQGKTEAAERWFVRAGELAPHDFTIRRGSMPNEASMHPARHFSKCVPTGQRKATTITSLCPTWRQARKISKPNRYPKPTSPPFEPKIRRSARSSFRRRNW
jgi:hypothetical protein